MRYCFRQFVIVFFLFFAVSFLLVHNKSSAKQHEDFSGKIAFVADVNGNWDLFLADENGKNVAQLTDTPYDENEPHWSLDKKKIIYSTSNGELYVIDVNTKEQYQLPIKDKKGKKTNPSFSPDGKKIVYVHFKPHTADDTELVIFDLEKRTSRTLLDQYSPQFYTNWSVGGNYIVYTMANCSMDCGQIIQELWMADVRGGYARQILMTNSLCMQPIWSSDGQKIAFSSDKSGNFDVWIFSLKDGSVIQVTTDIYSDTCPAWSPDGHKIAFVSSRTGGMKIWVKNLKTDDLNMISPFKDKDVEYRDVAW